MSMWLLILLTLLLTTTLTVAVARVIRRDGLGHRTPPASRYDWSERTTW